MLLVIVVIDYFFFFKQKTAYEMRISDLSSDVCSSDLFLTQCAQAGDAFVHRRKMRRGDIHRLGAFLLRLVGEREQRADLIGRKAEAARVADEPRSEEHTSELQSLMRTSYADFCLKKKHTHQ